MECESHYYAEGYSPENDPYVMENGVLKNHLGITDTALLNQYEQRLSNFHIVKILVEWPSQGFDVEYFKSLHRTIFGEVYPWAGEFRKVDIGKGDTLFLPHTQIEHETQHLFNDLADENFLYGSTHEIFSHKMGEYLIRLNQIHPFREGNGRTQRVLVSKIAQHAGMRMDWSSISNEAMKRACIEGVNGNIRNMVRLILLNSKKTN